MRKGQREVIMKGKGRILCSCDFSWNPGEKPRGRVVRRLIALNRLLGDFVNGVMVSVVSSLLGDSLLS